jgi:hypothetical protein
VQDVAQLSSLHGSAHKVSGLLFEESVDNLSGMARDDRQGVLNHGGTPCGGNPLNATVA